MKVSLYIDMDNNKDLAQLKYLGELARKILDKHKPKKEEKK